MTATHATRASVPELRRIAARLRRSIIDMIWHAGSGHPGGSLGIADLLAALYFRQMRIDPANINWPERDRFVLSKGHCAPAIYAVLAERGYYDHSHLRTLRKMGSILQGHPDMHKTPGVDMTTGCLGEGLSAALGMALAARVDKKDYLTYALLSDGELMEGQTWEAALFAGGQQLRNIVAIVDDNGCLCDDHARDVLAMGSLADKWKAFGWRVLSIDGHDMDQIVQGLEEAANIAQEQGPVVILAKCVKGKGVTFMEDQPNWHGQIMKESEFRQAMAELEGTPA